MPNQTTATPPLRDKENKKYQNVRICKIDQAIDYCISPDIEGIYLLAENANLCVASRTSVSVLFRFCLAQSDLFFRLLCWSCGCGLATSLGVPLGRRRSLIRLTCCTTLITLHTILACEFLWQIGHVLLEIGSIAGLRLHLLLVLLGCR